MSKPVLSDPITLRIPVDILAEIDAIAETTERSRSWIIVRALKSYLHHEGADILSYRNGMEEVARGDVTDLDKTLADMDRIVSDKVA
jgi:predicted transcriptional regulator